jgi:hypothetical protein
MARHSQAKEDPLLIRVGQVMYALDRETIEALNSDFLSRLVDPESDFQKPLDGVYEVHDRDAESFSALVHMARFQSVPSVLLLKENRAKLFEEADFWGVKEKLEEAKLKGELDVSLSRFDFSSVYQKCQQVADLEMHHNFCKDDGARRIYCGSCGDRHVDSRYSVGSNYSKCIKCDTPQIKYNPDLKWCHKWCQACQRCQDYVYHATDDMYGHRPKSASDVKNDARTMLMSCIRQICFG